MTWTEATVLIMLGVPGTLACLAYASGFQGKRRFVQPYLKACTGGASVGILLGLVVAFVTSTFDENFDSSTTCGLVALGAVCGLGVALAIRLLRNRFLGVWGRGRRHFRMALLVVALSGAFCRMTVPCRLSGNWVGTGLTSHLCEDHAFLHIEAQKATFYHDGTLPDDWGTLDKTGWNTYDLYIPGNKQPITLHVGWFLVRGSAPEFKTKFWAVRDCRRWDCKRIMRETESLPRMRVARDLERKFAGEWRSRQFSCNAVEFQSATGLVFRVSSLRPLSLDTNTGDLRGEMLASMTMEKREGQKETFYDSLPHLIGRDTMVASELGGDSYRFDYSLTNGVLDLEMTRGEWFFRAKLQRAAEGSGPSLDAPGWIDLWRGLNRKFGGVWESRDFQSDWDEFADVTNVAFYVYAVTLRQTNALTRDMRAEMSAELVVRKRDGTERLAADSLPVWLYADRITFGFPDSFSLRYSFTNGHLVLEKTSEHANLQAKLKRVRLDPGKPRFLPRWF